jgi:hypothetical protein
LHVVLRCRDLLNLINKIGQFGADKKSIIIVILFENIEALTGRLVLTAEARRAQSFLWLSLP